MHADLKHENVTDAILCCFYTVYNVLGYGFQEKVCTKMPCNMKSQNEGFLR